MVKILSDTIFSGSKGSATYSRNKGGAYIRNRSTPTNPNSPRQQDTRSIFGGRASGWSSLTQANRDAWNAYAQTNPVTDKLGQQIYLSGIQWYVKLNSRIIDAGGTAISLPPTGSGPVGFASFSVAVTSAGVATVTFTPALPVGTRVQLWQTIPGTVGSSPNFRQARLVGYSSAVQASPWAATAVFIPQTGQAVRFFGAIMDTFGRLSAMREHSAIAV